MLGADVGVPELQRLPQRQSQHLLGPRRERDVARGRALATACDLLDPVPCFLQGDAQRLQRQGGDALSLGEQAEQQMLGADRTVTEFPGLVLRQDDDLPGPVGERREHVLGPGPYRGPLDSLRERQRRALSHRCLLYSGRGTAAGPQPGRQPVRDVLDVERAPQLEFSYRTALARYSHIVAGRLPGGGGAAGQQTVVQVAVTADTAARLGLRVGSRLNAGTVELVVTGIIRPADPAAAFWTQSVAAASPVLAQGSSAQQYWSGAVFIGAGALPLIESALGPTEMQVTWVYAAALGGLNAEAASNLDASLDSMASSGATFLTSGIPITAAVTSQIPSVLAPFIAGESAAAPVLELLYVSLAVLGAVVVLLGARLVAQRRAAEFTLMRARGAALLPSPRP